MRLVSNSLALVLILLFTFIGVNAQENQLPPPPIYLSYEQRLFLSYVIETHGLNQNDKKKLAKRMVAFFDEVKKRGVDNIEVDSFDDFIRQYRGDWKNSYHLGADLKHLENDFYKSKRPLMKIYSSKNPEIQKMIENYQAQSLREGLTILEEYKNPLVGGVQDFFLKKFEGLKNPASALRDAVDKGKDFFKRMNQSHKEGKAFVSEEVALKLIENSDEVMKTVDRNLELVVGKILKKFDGMITDRALNQAMKIAVEEYVKKMPLEMKKPIMSSVLSLPTNTSELELFSHIMQYADPIFQKFLQGFANYHGAPKELSEILKKFESDIYAAPNRLVEHDLEAAKKDYNLTSIEKEAYAAGSVRQQHKGIMKLPSGEEVAVSVGIRKPGVGLKFNSMKEVFKGIVNKIDHDEIVRSSKNFPRLTYVMTDNLNAIEQEIDTDHVRNNQHAAVLRYDQTAPVELETMNGKRVVIEHRVPKVFFPQNGNKHSNVLVQKFVEKGKKLNSLEINGIDHEDLAKNITTENARDWLEAILFKKGYFNSDPHPGNSLYVVKENNDQTIKIEREILDWGMTGKLDVLDRAKFINLGTNIEASNIRGIIESLWSLSAEERNWIAMDEFAKQMEAEAKRQMKIHGELARDSEFWFRFANSLGLELKPQFNILFRGYGFLSESLLAVKGPRFDQLGKEVGLKNFGKTVFYDLLPTGASSPTLFEKLQILRKHLDKLGLPKGCAEFFKNILPGPVRP